jgi:Ca2+-binding EF-hand superfamily protein
MLSQEVHMLRILLAFLLIGSVPAAASAQGKSRTGGADAVLQQWDADHDGTLDLAEAKKAAAAKFDALDRDHDGTLDKKELNSSAGRALLRLLQ